MLMQQLGGGGGGKKGALWEMCKGGINPHTGAFPSETLASFPPIL